MALKPRDPRRPAAAVTQPRGNTGRTTMRPTASRPKFSFKKRVFESSRERANRKGGRFDVPFKNGFEIFRAQEGDNLIRILPPTFDTPDNHYSYVIWVHKYVGPDSSTYLCRRKMLNKPCACCDVSDSAAAEGDDEEAKKYAAKEDYVCWVIDRKATKSKDTPMLYQMSVFQDRDLVDLTVDKVVGGLIDIEDPNVGFDVSLRRTGKFLNTRYLPSIVRHPSPISDDPKLQDQILQYITDHPVPSTLKFYDNEYLKRMLEGGLEEADELDTTASADEPAAGEEADETYDPETGEYDSEAAEAAQDADDPNVDPETGEPWDDPDSGEPADDVQYEEEEPEPEPEPEPVRRPAPRLARPAAGKLRPAAGKATAPRAQPARPTAQPARPTAPSPSRGPVQRTENRRPPLRR